MAITFSGKNLETYEVSSVHQLVGLRSQKDRSYRISVLQSNIDGPEYTSVVIYNEEKNVNIVSLLVSCKNDVLGVSDAIITRQDLVTVLTAFGFYVSFVDLQPLDQDTADFLRSLYAVGYRYFNFTDAGMFVYMTDKDKKSLASDFTNFDKCDFSRFKLSVQPQSYYNIGDYI